jgi:HEAT repeat protein
MDQKHNSPVTLFYSYAREDEALRNELEKHLFLLQRRGFITAWHDRQIVPGTDWAHTIDRRLNESSIILLLISSGFLASDYCYNVEMQHALELHQRGEACVIPIIVRPVNWQHSPFAHLQCLPRDGKPVTEWDNQDAAFRDIAEGLLRTIEQQIGVVHSLSRRNYLRWLIERNYYLDPRGSFQTQRQVQVKMEEVYISLMAQREETPGKADRLLLEEELTNLETQLASSHATAEEIEDQREQVLAMFELNQGTNKLGEVLELAAVVTRHNRIVILGDPGSGKTTLLRYLALKHAQALWQGQQEASKDLGRAYFPIFICVAEYAENSTWKKQSLSNFLAEYHRLHECPNHGLTDLLQSELHKGSCLILLDGLDEIVSADERRGVVQRIEDFVRHHGNKDNRFVITSRIVGYRSAPLGSPFSHYVVREMNETQIHTFLEHWCQAVEDAQTPDISFQERRNIAKREIDGIMRAVRTSPGVRRLAANPLLLRILALIHRTGAQLPQKRVELYKLATDTLAHTWRTTQGVPESALVTDEYLTPLLSKLAYWLHIHKPTGIATEREVYTLLGEEWARLNGLHWDEDDPDPKIKEEVRMFLVAVREHTGLFVERAPKRYGFMHLTFEEYYAARSLVARSRTRARLIRKYLHDPRWEEPILLALGFVGLESSEEARGLLETAILAEGEEAKEFSFEPSPYENLLGRDYLFALRCIGDNIPMRPQVQKKLTERLANELEYRTGLAQYRQYRRALGAKLKFLEGSKLTPVLCSCLSGVLKNIPDYPARYELVLTIFTQWSQVPPEVLRILLEALNDTDHKVRRRAAESLGELRQASPEVISSLLQFTHDTVSDIRFFVIDALASLRQPISEIMAVLFQALQDSDPRVRSRAAFALEWQKQASPEVISALVQALHDDNSEVRRQAAYSLGMLGKTSPEVEAALCQLLQDDEHWVRSHAAVALGQLGHLSIDVILALLCVPDYDEQLWILSAARRVLRNVDLTSSEIVTILLGMLDDDSTNKRREAAQSLGRLGKVTPALQATLIKTLQDSHPDVRSAAAQSLGCSSDTTPEIILALIQALHDDDSAVRQAAAISLGNIGKATPEIIVALNDSLHTNSLQERTAVAQSLGRLGQISEQICEVLLEALYQIEDSKERSRSAYLLGKIGQSDELTIQRLLQMLINPEFETRVICSQALVGLGRKFPATQAMIEQALTQAIKQPEFDKLDGSTRSGHDHIYEALCMLVVGDKSLEQNYESAIPRFLGEYW